MAIKACAQEKGHLVQNRERMQIVRESLNEGYCDISGRVGDLVHVGSYLLIPVSLTVLMASPGQVQSIRVFVSQGTSYLVIPTRPPCSYITDVPRPNTIISTKQATLARFVVVIQSLAGVYKI